MNPEEYSIFEIMQQELALQVDRQRLLIEKVKDHQILTEGERALLIRSFERLEKLSNKFEEELTTVGDAERRAQLKRARDALHGK